jgi:RNA polymerase sigma factor (TIGR02999 family)
MSPERTVTDLLLSWRGGDEGAIDLLIPRIYDELRRVARRQLAGERPGQTLGATELVHEAFLRLVDVEVSWNDRVHFLAVGARVMRRIRATAHRDLRLGKAWLHDRLGPS